MHIRHMSARTRDVVRHSQLLSMNMFATAAALVTINSGNDHVT